MSLEFRAIMPQYVVDLRVRDVDGAIGHRIELDSDEAARALAFDTLSNMVRYGVLPGKEASYRVTVRTERGRVVETATLADERRIS